MDEANKVIAFERGGLVFLFNFHPENSIPDYRFKVREQGEYRIILSSDDARFGGFDRVDTTVPCLTNEKGELRVYATNRTALVFRKV